MRDRSKVCVFLAGSIEMGAAEDWQTKLGNYLVDKNFTVFNPRRVDWDSSWTQSFSNPQFNVQVNWELHALKLSDIIVMYLDPNTKSPISLLELGLHANSKKLHVVCPNGFYRKGNIESVCFVYDIPLYNSIEELKERLFNK